MIKIILFICFLPVALFEVFFYKQFGLVVVGTLYLVLAMQAEMSAKTFVLHGFRWPIQTRQSSRKRRHDGLSEEELRVQPLGEKAKQEYVPMRQEPVVEERPIETVPLSRPSPFRVNVAPRNVTELPKTPNYRGPAHEVLAIPENAATRTIKRAFRFWIKKVHPDQNQGNTNDLANRRVQKITEAKEHLLERRRAKKAA